MTTYISHIQHASLSHEFVSFKIQALPSVTSTLQRAEAKWETEREMGSLSFETKSGDSGSFWQEDSNPDHEFLQFGDAVVEDKRNPPTGLLRSETETKKKKKKNPVFLEGYVEVTDEDDLLRTKSLTDEDLEELKGCLDLGFGFSYEEIPELCNTLPALELCYSMSQKFLDEQQRPLESSPLVADTSSPASGPIANWKISSPGDHPEDVKARLKYWAQAVACTVKLCS